eukprot:5056188-Pyramimonas_sp.AAC.1
MPPRRLAVAAARRGRAPPPRPLGGHRPRHPCGRSQHIPIAAAFGRISSSSGRISRSSATATATRPCPATTPRLPRMPRLLGRGRDRPDAGLMRSWR